MYAVVKTGGKQYKVAPGEKLKVEQIPADVGAEVILDQVLLVGEGEAVRLGQPSVAGATVKATVVAQGRMVRKRVPLVDVLQVGQSPGRTLWLQAKGRRTLVLRMAETRIDEKGGLPEIQQRLRDLAAAAGATLDEPLEERVPAPRPRTPLFGV